MLISLAYLTLIACVAFAFVAGINLYQARPAPGDDEGAGGDPASTNTRRSGPRITSCLISAIIVGFLLAYITLPGLFVVGFPAGWMVPIQFNKYLRKRRLEKLESQLPDALSSLSNSLHAGLSLPEAVRIAAQDAPKPLNEELGEIHRDYTLGVRLENAFQQAQDRIRSTFFDILSVSLRVHIREGGDLAPILDDTGHVIREMARLRAEFKTNTAEGRASMMIITVLPVVVLIMMVFISPNGTRMLFETPFGRIILLTAIGINALAYFIARLIINRDI